MKSYNHVRVKGCGSIPPAVLIESGIINKLRASATKKDEQGTLRKNAHAVHLFCKDLYSGAFIEGSISKPPAAPAAKSPKDDGHPSLHNGL